MEDLLGNLECIRRAEKSTADPELLEVAPKLVPMDHPLAVGGMLNAVMLKTDN